MVYGDPIEEGEEWTVEADRDGNCDLCGGSLRPGDRITFHKVMGRFGKEGNRPIHPKGKCSRGPNGPPPSSPGNLPGPVQSGKSPGENVTGGTTGSGFTRASDLPPGNSWTPREVGYVHVTVEREWHHDGLTLSGRQATERILVRSSEMVPNRDRTQTFETSGEVLDKMLNAWLKRVSPKDASPSEARTEKRPTKVPEGLPELSEEGIRAALAHLAVHPEDYRDLSKPERDAKIVAKAVELTVKAKELKSAGGVTPNRSDQSRLDADASSGMVLPPLTPTVTEKVANRCQDCSQCRGGSTHRHRNIQFGHPGTCSCGACGSAPHPCGAE